MGSPFNEQGEGVIFGGGVIVLGVVELGFSGVGDYLREVIAIARIFPGVIVRGVRLSLGGIFPGGIFQGLLSLGYFSGG